MSNKCIYCQKNDNWSQEHCIPFGLGAFKNAHILNETVCSSCNTIISKCETQFLRCGPEAFFRQIVGVEGRKDHKSKSPFYYGSSGGAAIKLTCKHPTEDFDVLCEIDLNTKNAFMSNQIIFKNDSGKIIQVPIVPDRINDKLFEEPFLSKIIKNKNYPICYCIEKNKEELLLKILKKNFPQKKATKINCPTEEEKKLFLIDFKVTNFYFRAIAKIAFHYFLSVFSKQFVGNEVEFEPIRSFIYLGKGDQSNFINQIDKQFIYDFNKGFITKDWGHLLAVEKTSKFIYVSAQFFVGPKHLPPVFNIFIGKNPQKIICPENFGHFYSYYATSNQNGFDGEVSELQSMRILQNI